MQEQELFQGYEVKNWNFSPRIYKILAASAIFNIFALLVVAQTNLLTTKGCDSPLVGKFCQVLDTLYVGGTVLTTNSEYVSDPYDPTVLPESDEIVWIPVGEDPFRYPEGYFALSNPESVIPQEIPGDGTFPDGIPGIPNPTTGGSTDLMNQPQVLPPPNDNAVTNLPSSPFSIDNNPTIPRGRTPRVRTPKVPKNNPTLSNNSLDSLDLGDKTATTDNPTDPNNKTDKNLTTGKDEKVADVVINKKVMKDFASVVKTKYDKKEVDLSQNFKVVADGVLTPDGKLDITLDKKTKQPKSRILSAEGNEQMVEIAKQAIAAIGDSGWLGYLRNQGVDKINFTVIQDNDQLKVIITSDFPTPQRAQTVTTGVEGAISTALLLDKNDFKKLGADEKVLLSNAKATVNPDNAKQFVLNFALPKPVAQEMITRKLNEPEEKTTEGKPSGSTAQIKENNTTSAK